jgi:hypothetical protein
MAPKYLRNSAFQQRRLKAWLPQRHRNDFVPGHLGRPALRPCGKHPLAEAFLQYAAEKLAGFAAR